MTHGPAFSDLSAKFARTAEEQREHVVELCARLVAAPSINPPGDTRLVAAIVRTALSGLGVESRLEARDPTMPNVIAELDSGRAGPHLVLNVHMDTMPPGDETLWSTPPFELTRSEGLLAGLGMGNMKGAVAAMVHAFGMLAANREAWPGKITFTAVSDEVVFGDNGAAHLLQSNLGLVGDGMICGEGPGYKRLAIGEKGVLWLRLTAQGTPGHSSSVRRLNSASARLAAVISEVDQLNGTRFAIPAELAPLFDAEDQGFELTANVGVIRAGTFIGQVAVEGSAEIDLRIPPGATCDETQMTVERIVAKVGGVTVQRIKGWNPTWTGPDTKLARAWMTATSSLGNEPPGFAVRLPASDASRWRLEGVPAVCYGPQMTLSAGINESAEEDEVLRCAALYAACAIQFLR